MYRFILFLVSMCSVLLATAQNIKPATASIGATHASENANGAINIDYSTGLFNYSIPLFQVGDENYSYPINISYTGKGVKLEQKNSQLGIGWSINTGGVITRIIRGLPDESYPEGFFYSPVVSGDTATQSQLLQYYKSINKQEKDGEADLYIASFGAMTVRFTLRKNNGILEAVPFEHTNVKIEMDPGLFSSDEAGWKITDEQGNVFLFHSQEYTKQIARVEPNNSFINYKWRIMSWHLSEVQTLHGKRIFYSYEQQRRWPELNKWLGVQAHLYSTPKMVTDIAQASALWETRTRHLNELQALSAESDQLLNQIRVISEVYGQMATMGYSNYRHTMSTMQPSFLGDTTLDQTEKDEIYAASIYSPGGAFDMQYGSLNSYVDLLLTFNQNVQFHVTGLKAQIENIDLAIQNANIPLHGETINFSSYTEIYPLRIKSINFDNRILSFTYLKTITILDTVLYDVTHKAGYLIKDITLASKLGGVVRKVEFNYDLFNLSDKILLDSISFKGDSIENELSYSFNYNKYNPPVFGSDYWGYFTTKNDQERGLPDNTIYFGFFFEPLNSLNYTSAFNEIQPTLYDRFPDSTVVDIFSLSQIQLPSGGSVSINYEPNQIFMDNPSYKKNVLCGGQRIRSLIHTDPITGHADSTIYKYHFLDRRDSTMKSTAFKRGIDGLTYESSNPSNYFISSDIITAPQTVFDPGNESVFYSYVEEITKAGSIGYKYLRSPEELSSLNFNKKFHPYWLDKLLLAKVFYSTDGKVVRVERNKYSPGFMSGNEQFHLKNYGLYFNDEQNKTDYVGIEQRRMNPYDSSHIFTNNLYQDSYILYLNVDSRLVETEVIDLTDALPLGTINYSVLPGLPSFREYDYERALNDPSLMSGRSNIRSITKYKYTNDKYNLIRTVESMTNGKGYIKRYKYPQDYRLDPLHWTKTLLNDNRINAPIEEQLWIKNYGTNTTKLAGGALTEFSKYENANLSVLLPINTYKMELQSPLEMSHLWVNNDYVKDTFNVLFPDSQLVYKIATKLVYNFFGNAKFKPSIIQDINKGVTIQRAVDLYAGQEIFNGTMRSDSVSYALGFNNIPRSFFRYKLKREEAGWLNNVYFFEPFFLQDHVDVTDSIFKDLTELYDSNATGLYNNLMFDAAYEVIKSIHTRTPFPQLEKRLDILDSLYERSVYDLSLQAQIDTMNTYSSMLNLYDFGSVVAYLYAFHYHCNTSEIFNEIMQPAIMSTRLPQGQTVGYHSFTLSLNKVKQAADSLRIVLLNKFPSYRRIFYRIINNGAVSGLNEILMTNFENFSLGKVEVKNIVALAGAQIEFSISYDHLAHLPSLVVVPDNYPFLVNVYDPKGNLILKYDQNLNSNTFEYDGYNRLLANRDKDGAILQQIEYGLNTNSFMYLNTGKSGVFEKESCGMGYVGSAVTYSIPAGKFGSNISQADADQKAQQEVDISGQAFANVNGHCIRRFSNITYSATFYRNNCNPGNNGSPVVYTVPAGSFTSFVSQADADQKAQQDATSNGQAYANTNGICSSSYINIQMDSLFIRNDCSIGNIGSAVVYNVPYNTFTSIISQADANQKALDDIILNGQAYANSQGTCSPTLITVTYENFDLISGDYVWFTNNATNESFMFDMNAFSGTLGQIPPGNYMVYITNYSYFNGNPSFYPRNFEMGSYYSYDYEGFFYGIDIDNGNSHVNVY